jgi:hypothetical protein
LGFEAQKVVYMFPDNAVTPRGRFNATVSKQMLTRLHNGSQAEVGVFSLTVGGTGLNAQVFNTLIFMSPCSSTFAEIQGKGDILTYTVLIF